TDPATDSIWRVNQLGRAFACRVRAGSKPSAIASGPDGAMWFTEPGTNRIGRLPVGGQCNRLTEVAIPTANADPAAIVAGTDNAGDQIGRFRVKDAAVTTYKVPTANAQPTAMTLGPDAQVYFTEYAAD